MTNSFFSVRLLSVLRGHSVFSSPPQRSMTSDFKGFSIPDFIHNIYFPILILEKEPVFPFRMFSAKQGHYWYHFYNVFGMTRSLTELNPGPPALEASTIPLGYRGGGYSVSQWLHAYNSNCNNSTSKFALNFEG